MENILIQYKFIQEITINYGMALYLSGSVKQLGYWNPQIAIKMEYVMNKYWGVTVEIPININIQYKYFIATYDNKDKKIVPIKWIGQKNYNLLITQNNIQKFKQQNKNKLQIMSFNIRYENKQDKNDNSWTNRKKNCIDLITQYFPDVIGIQQALINQKIYLLQHLKSYYKYYGKARDLHEGQQSGIFIRKDKYFVLEDGYIWLNQYQKEGLKGFGARLPRYFTYLIATLPDQKDKYIMFLNTHLDHQSQIARFQSIKIISLKIMQKIKQFGQKLSNIFLTGDFNVSDKDEIFKNLIVGSKRLQSMRYITNNTDTQSTFNGFSTLLAISQKSKIIIDHIFVYTQNYQPFKFQVIRKNDKVYSDHYPIVGTFIKSK